MNKTCKYKMQRWRNRWKMVFRFGLIDSKTIADDMEKESGRKLSRWFIFFDMIKCYHKYHIWTNQYKKERFWTLPAEERDLLGEKYKKRNEGADKLAISHAMENQEYFKYYNDNRKFLVKYSGFEWEKNSRTRAKRKKAYVKQYNMGRGGLVQYGVTFISEHGVIGELKIGERVRFTRNVDIDYTGGLVIGNGVNIAEGVKILTHGHSYLFRNKESIDKYHPNTFATPLTIGDNVFIGVHAIIMPGVTSIGENSIISAGSIVTRAVPPNSIVTSNSSIKIQTIPPGMRTLFAYDPEMYNYDRPAQY